MFRSLIPWRRADPPYHSSIIAIAVGDKLAPFLFSLKWRTAIEDSTVTNLILVPILIPIPTQVLKVILIVILIPILMLILMLILISILISIPILILILTLVPAKSVPPRRSWRECNLATNASRRREDDHGCCQSRAQDLLRRFGRHKPLLVENNHQTHFLNQLLHKRQGHSKSCHEG